jgi:hypothetical protein
MIFPGRSPAMKRLTATVSVLLLVTACGDTTGPGSVVLQFSGGFESGTMLVTQSPPGDWDQLTATHGNMFMSQQSHLGDWAVEASVDSACGIPAWGAFLSKDFDWSGDVLYARVWFMLLSGHNFSGTPGRGFEFLRLCDDQLETVCSFEIAHMNQATTILVNYTRMGAGGIETVTHDMGIGLGTDSWHYFEVEVVRDSIGGSVTVWVDDWSVPYTGINNMTGIDLERLCVGIVDTGGDATGSMRFDDYAMAEARIGME